MKFLTIKFILLGGVIVGLLFLAYFKVPELLSLDYNPQADGLEAHPESGGEAILSIIKPRPKATHLKTPEPLKAVYMTSWVAGSKERRGKIVELIERTELNAIVIDIKDYSGRIAFRVYDPYLKEIGSVEKRIPDVFEFIQELHEKNIYVIGRISVFQDLYLTEKLPDLAVKRASDGKIWRDRKGISWFDPGAREIWNYTAAIAKESYEVGFDELNFDYIRFPSDGNMSDISYPFSEGEVKSVVLLEFFSYLNKQLKPMGAVLSADLFGMTTTNTDDLNIGQFLEYTLPYFDFVSPMVYPSHYPKGWNGIAKPAENPYSVVNYSMTKAVRRLKALDYDPLKLRPWLQDFNLGATYTAEMVRAQMKATYDAGLTSWMLWNAANTYTTAALQKQESVQ